MTYVSNDEDALLLFLFLLLATIPSGVKGLMLANLAFARVEVEPHSWRLFLESAAGNEALRCSPSSSNSSLDLRLRGLGADLGEVMVHSELGEPRPSNSLMALMVWEGGEGELKGLWPSELRVLGPLSFNGDSIML